MSVKASLASSLDATSPRRAEYVHVPPLAMADGTVLTPYKPTTPDASFVITSNCENLDAAYRLGDLLCSEKYVVWNRWGQKDVDWVVPGEDAVAMYAALGYKPYLQETGNIVWGQPQNQSRPQRAPLPPVAPKTADQLFEEKLKAFMSESDSKLSGIRADHRTKSRRR